MFESKHTHMMTCFCETLSQVRIRTYLEELSKEIDYLCPYRNMKTTHKIYTKAAQNMSSINNSSIELVVTSPPYPMIEMWDEIMSKQNPEIAIGLKDQTPSRVFELMHQELDKVWSEVARVLVPGGIACINIGDATRTFDGNFALYSNHSLTISQIMDL